MKEKNVDKLAKIIWDYHHMNQQVKKADCIFALGSHDVRVAERATDLFLQGYAPYLVFSGGVGILTKDVFNKPEAEVFTDIAISRGVPRDKIIIENKATNTGENIRFTKQLLKEKGFDFNSFILVQKPYMERRAHATFKKIWPEKDFIVTSPQISFEDYLSGEIPREKIINILVGDLQRIKEYSTLGFQISQDIPALVWDAYNKLIEAGYTKHLIKI